MMRTVIIYLILFLASINAQDWGRQSGSFFRMGMTARSLAMGGGFTAELDQNFPAFHNPAWSAFLLRKHFGSSYTNLTLDRRLTSTSFSMALPPTAGIGLAWVSGGVNKIQGRYNTGMKSSEMQTGENAIMITFAQRILPWLSLGANFKIIRYDLPITDSDQVSGSGIGFDLGLLVKSGSNISFGIMVQDISSNYQWDTNDIYAEGGPYKEKFPTIYRIGSRYYKKMLNVVGDIGLITDHDTYLSIQPRLGLEYGILEQYFIRGGYGNGKLAIGVGYRYGLFNYNDSHIDYAYSLDWASQPAHTISYAFNF